MMEGAGEIDRSFVLIFDADNTLWDTNAVFHAAHVAMLGVFEEAQLLSNARDQVVHLRAIDRALMKHYDRHEYDFKTLVAAVAHHFARGLSIDDAATYAALHGEADFDVNMRVLMQNAYDLHIGTLAELPPLFPGVMEILSHFETTRARPPHVAIVMFSEGHPERLKQTIAGHALGQVSYFNEIVMEKKDVQSFKRVGALGCRCLPDAARRDVTTVVIGDSMQRDIRYANEAGFTTVYIPSPFQGVEIPQCDIEQPDFQIESLLELPSVMAALGLDLSALDLSGLKLDTTS